VHALLAHQGGWDEFLLVAVPIAVVIGALAIAKHRVDANALRSTEPDDLTQTERE
jgi:hypothetical protein